MPEALDHIFQCMPNKGQVSNSYFGRDITTLHCSADCYIYVVHNTGEHLTNYITSSPYFHNLLGGILGVMVMSHICYSLIYSYC